MGILLSLFLYFTIIIIINNFVYALYVVFSGFSPVSVLSVVYVVFDCCLYLITTYLPNITEDIHLHSVIKRRV